MSNKEIFKNFKNLAVYKGNPHQVMVFNCVVENIVSEELEGSTDALSKWG